MNEKDLPFFQGGSPKVWDTGPWTIPSCSKGKTKGIMKYFKIATHSGKVVVARFSGPNIFWCLSWANNSSVCIRVVRKSISPDTCKRILFVCLLNMFCSKQVSVSSLAIPKSLVWIVSQKSEISCCCPDHFLCVIWCYHSISGELGN